MSFTTRVCVFSAIAIAGIIAWQWNTTMDSSSEAAQLAVKQFQNSDGVAERLQQASLAQNWWPLVWPVLLVMLGLVMFWEDVERLWKNDSAQV